MTSFVRNLPVSGRRHAGQTVWQRFNPASRLKSLYQTVQGEVLTPNSLLNQVREMIVREPMVAVLAVKLFSIPSFAIVCNTKKDKYANWAIEAEEGNAAALESLVEAVKDKNDLDAIPWLGVVANGGVKGAWEALYDLLTTGTPQQKDRARMTLMNLNFGELADPIRDSNIPANLDPDDSYVNSVVKLLQLLAVALKNPKVIWELETIPNDRAGQALRTLVDKGLEGAQTSYRRWRQKHSVSVPSVPRIESTKKSRVDETVKFGVLQKPKKPEK